MKYGNALLWTAGTRYSKKCDSQASSHYTVVFLSIDTMWAPAFTFPTAVFPNCLCQLCCFLHQHVSILRNTIVYRDIKIYCSNVKTLRFLEKLRSVSAMLFLCNSGAKQPIALFFHCRPIKHRYTNFRAYLDFHKMWDVPGFFSGGHIWYEQIWLKCQSSNPVHNPV